MLDELESSDFTDVGIKAKQKIVQRFHLSGEKLEKFENILFKLKKRVARQTDWSGKIITISLEFFYYFLLIHFSWKHFYLNSNICQNNNFEDLIKVLNSYTLTILLIIRRKRLSNLLVIYDTYTKLLYMHCALYKLYQ